MFDDLTIPELARIAGCGYPDSSVSAGAVLLRAVAVSVAESIGYGDDRGEDEIAGEIAGSAPSVYTYRVWAEFTDLSGWDEDMEGYESDTITNGATIALQLICERLALALLTR